MGHLWFISIICSVCLHKNVLSHLRHLNAPVGKVMLDSSYTGPEQGQTSKRDHPCTGPEQGQTSKMDHSSTGPEQGQTSKMDHLNGGPEQRQTSKMDHLNSGPEQRQTSKMDHSSTSPEQGQTSKMDHLSSGQDSKQPIIDTFATEDDLSNLHYYKTDREKDDSNVSGSGKIKLYNFNHVPESRQPKMDHYIANVPERHQPKLDHSAIVKHNCPQRLDYTTNVSKWHQQNIDYSNVPEIGQFKMNYTINLTEIEHIFESVISWRDKVNIHANNCKNYCPKTCSRCVKAMCKLCMNTNPNETFEGYRIFKCLFSDDGSKLLYRPRPECITSLCMYM